jgi:hypothetical protein
MFKQTGQLMRLPGDKTLADRIALREIYPRFSPGCF